MPSRLQVVSRAKTGNYFKADAQQAPVVGDLPMKVDQFYGSERYPLSQELHPAAGADRTAPDSAHYRAIPASTAKTTEIEVLRYQFSGGNCHSLASSTAAKNRYNTHGLRTRRTPEGHYIARAGTWLLHHGFPTKPMPRPAEIRRSPLTGS